MDIQSFLSMLVLTLCLCQTVVVQSLGETQLAEIVDRVGRQTLVCAGVACAIGFWGQLVALRPSASSASLPVLSELPTDALASHMWPWIVFGLLWLALNAARIYQLHRARARLVRETMNALQRCKREDANLDDLAAEAFQMLDACKRGQISPLELRPFLHRIARADNATRKGRWRSALDERVLVDKPQAIGLEDFQKLVKTRVAGASDVAKAELEQTRSRIRNDTGTRSLRKRLAFSFRKGASAPAWAPAGASVETREGGDEVHGRDGLHA